MIPIDPHTGKATGIRLFSCGSVQMRTFHMTWIAFCLCFFGWFGLAPFGAQIKEEMGLSDEQMGNLKIAAVASTIFGRLIIGWICDRFGPRLSYTGLLIIGSIPVACSGLATDYSTLLIMRALIGIIGASFVITQYHTAAMFAPNCVGTANATTAGWGNMGAGLANACMPLLAGAFLFMGCAQENGWRYAMVVAGILTFCTGIAYFFVTQDTPHGNLKDLKKNSGAAKKNKVPLSEVLKDHRVWVLSMVYGCCFGVELVIHLNAAEYYYENFDLDLTTAGLIAGSFGIMALFARSLGGFFGDRIGRRLGLAGRVRWLFFALLAEALALACFSYMSSDLGLSIVALLIFALCVHMSAGATYSVTPFINRTGYGTVSGIVGAGGNVGAVAAGFLFRGNLPMHTAFMIMAAVVGFTALCILTIRFRHEDESIARTEMQQAVISQHQHRNDIKKSQTEAVHVSQ